MFKEFSYLSIPQKEVFIFFSYACAHVGWLLTEAKRPPSGRPLLLIIFSNRSDESSTHLAAMVVIPAKSSAFP